MGLLDDLTSSERDRHKAENGARHERTIAAVSVPYELLPATREAVADFWRRDWTKSRGWPRDPVFSHVEDGIDIWLAAIFYSTEPHKWAWLDQKARVTSSTGIPISTYQRQVQLAAIKNLDAYVVAVLIRWLRTHEGEYLPLPPKHDELARLENDPLFKRELQPLDRHGLTEFIRGNDEVLQHGDAAQGASPTVVVEVLKAMGYPTEPDSGGWEVKAAYYESIDEYHSWTAPPTLLMPDGSINARTELAGRYVYVEYLDHLRRVYLSRNRERNAGSPLSGE